MAENNQANAPAQEQDLSEILKVRREKLAALRTEGRDPFQQTRFDVSHHAQDIKDHFDELEGTEVTVGGRLMSKRGMGKVSFCDLQDKSGRIQIYARKDEMDEEEYNRFKKYDIGDIVGVRGEVFRTQRGEMSVRAKEITLLSKSLRPLPENSTVFRTRSYATVSVTSISSSIPRASATLRSARNLWRSCAATSTTSASWRSRRPCSAPSRAARTRGRSSRITIRSTLICICASPPSCTSSA